MKILESLLKPRTLFTLMFFSTFCYLIVTKNPVPAILNSVVSGLLGYYYGEKKTNGNSKKEK